MRYGISKDYIMKGPVTKGEVGALVWKCPKTDCRVSTKKRRVLRVV
jgi:hypothetical protein